MIQQNNVLDITDELKLAKQERKNQLRNELALKWPVHGIRLVNEFYMLEKIVDLEILQDMTVKIRSNGNTFLLKLHKSYPFEGIVKIKIVESDHIDIKKNYQIGNHFMDDQYIEIPIHWSPKNRLEEVMIKLNNFVSNCKDIPDANLW